MFLSHPMNPIPDHRGKGRLVALCCWKVRVSALFAQSNSDVPQTQSVCRRHVELHGAFSIAILFVEAVG